MTKEEKAIRLLSMIKADELGELEPLPTWYQGIDKDIAEAVELAIEALSQPQGDTISRQAAIERIDEYIEEYNYVDADGNHEPKWCAMMEAKMVLEELPSSQPDIEAMLSEIEEARELWNYDTMEHEIYTECLEVIDKYSHSKPQPDIEAILKEIDEYKHRKLSMGIGIEDLEKGKQIALDYVMAIIDKHIQKPQERSDKE